MAHFTLAGFHDDSKELTTSATDFKGRGWRPKSNFFDDRVRRASDVGPRQRTSKHRQALPKGRLRQASSKGISRGRVHGASSAAACFFEDEFDTDDFIQATQYLTTRHVPRSHWELGAVPVWVHRDNIYSSNEYLIWYSKYVFHKKSHWINMLKIFHYFTFATCSQ